MAINEVIKPTTWSTLTNTMKMAHLKELSDAVSKLQQYQKNVNNCNCEPSNCCQTIFCEKIGEMTVDNDGNIIHINTVCQSCQKAGTGCQLQVTTCQNMTCQQITCQRDVCESCQSCQSECNYGCQTCELCQSQCWCESCQGCQTKYCEEFSCQSNSCQTLSCEIISCENILCQSIKKTEN